LFSCALRAHGFDLPAHGQRGEGFPYYSVLRAWDEVTAA
jgi:hypothetical protein